VDGLVVMLCCNLTVEGDVRGNVFLLTGNLSITSSADVKGDVMILTGNVSE
jgi:cytoskeletal protein CcmA (bactofilin family)